MESKGPRVCFVAQNGLVSSAESHLSMMNMKASCASASREFVVFEKAATERKGGFLQISMCTYTLEVLGHHFFDRLVSEPPLLSKGFSSSHFLNDFKWWLTSRV